MKYDLYKAVTENNFNQIEVGHTFKLHKDCGLQRNTYYHHHMTMAQLNNHGNETAIWKMSSERCFQIVSLQYIIKWL